MRRNMELSKLIKLISNELGLTTPQSALDDFDALFQNFCIQLQSHHFFLPVNVSDQIM